MDVLVSSPRAGLKEGFGNTLFPWKQGITRLPDWLAWSLLDCQNVNWLA
jgi:hypothetical protein